MLNKHQALFSFSLQISNFVTKNTFFAKNRHNLKEERDQVPRQRRAAIVLIFIWRQV